MANWIIPLGLGLLGYSGQQQTARAQTRASDLEAQAAAKQAEIADYMLGKRRDVYDPIERDVFLPAMVKRAQEAPSWAPQARFWSSQLASKMAFPREDKPARPA